MTADAMRAKVIISEKELRHALALPDDTTITFLVGHSDPKCVEVGLYGPSVRAALEEKHRDWPDLDLTETQLPDTESSIIREDFWTRELLY